MADSDIGEVTQLLLDWRNGNEAALNKLMPLVYQSLKRIASQALSEWNSVKADQGIEPTLLVHEAYLRLIDQNQVDWQDRAHFYAIAAREIRRILIDEYRRNCSEKRGGMFTRVALSSAEAIEREDNIDLLILNAALEELATLDERQARIVELHFFGGHTNKEIAKLIGLGLSTVERELMHAKRWLRNRLKNS